MVTFTLVYDPELCTTTSAEAVPVRTTLTGRVKREGHDLVMVCMNKQAIIVSYYQRCNLQDVPLHCTCDTLLHHSWYDIMLIVTAYYTH